MAPTSSKSASYCTMAEMAMSRRSSADLLVGLEGDRLVRGPRQHVHRAHLVEERLVLERGVAPSELRRGGHRRLHHLRLLLRAAGVDLHGAAERLGDGLARGVVELGLHRHLRVRPQAVDAVLHRVLQAAGGRDDGQGAHAHRLHLHQPTGLPARRQQRVVAAGQQGVALGAHPAGVVELARELLLHGLRLLHQVRPAGAHDDHLQLSVLQHLQQALEQEVVPLLRVQAADEAHERPRGRGQPALLAVLGLEVLLGGDDSGRGEGPARYLRLRDKVLLCRGHALLDAVQDACDPRHREEALQLHPLLRVARALGRVRRRNRQRAVAVPEACCHGVHHLALLVVLAHLQRHGERDAVNVLLGHIEDIGQAWLGLEAALEDGVVAEEERLGIGPAAGVLLLVCVDEHGHQRAVPVVRHDDHILAVGKAAQRQLLHGQQRSLAEVGEARLVVCKVLAPFWPVQFRARQAADALQEGRVVAEDVVDLLLVCVEEVHRLLLACHGHGAREARVPSVLVLIVARRDHHDAVPKGRKGHRQAVHCLSETSCLGERGHLAGDKDDLVLGADGYRCLATSHGDGAADAGLHGSAHGDNRGAFLRQVLCTGRSRQSWFRGLHVRQGRAFRRSCGCRTPRRSGVGAALQHRHGLARHDVDHARRRHRGRTSWSGVAGAGLDHRRWP
mmetsp:Transcript_118938/g.348315  ORF Transcript_118938/g.348315 Transcript_118938/m.348315 type:complete len:675 (+) Transcript_118938:121-2145(+)